MLIAGTTTIVATVLFAWLGAHVGLSVAAAGGLMALADDSDAFCSTLLDELARRLSEDPFGLTADPSCLIGACLVGIIPAIAFMLWLLATSRNDRAGEEHGSAKWGNPKAMARFATENNPDPDNVVLLTRHVGLALSRTRFTREYDRNANVLVVGGSGAGKTRFYVKPNLCQCASDYIVTDPKGDTLPECGWMLVENGYDVRSFDTFVPERSCVYNPFAYVDTDLEVIEFVGAFFALTSDDQRRGGDQFWDDAAQLLLGALIAYLRDYTDHDRNYNFSGLMRLLDACQAAEDDESYESPLDTVFKQIETGYMRDTEWTGGGTLSSSPDGMGGRALGYARRPKTVWRESELCHRRLGRPYDNVHTDAMGNPERDANGNIRRGFDPDKDFALRCYKKFKTAAGKTLKSIIITVQVKFNAISTEQVRRVLTGRDEMHLEWLGDGEHKNAIFCTFKDTNQATLGFLHGMLVWQALNVMCDRATRDFDGHLPRHVNLILDEFKSLHMPKSIADMISVIRSRHVCMSIILQSTSQLKELYEEATAASIMDCCDTTLYLGGKSEQTTKMISDAVGQQTITTTSFSSQHGGSGGYSKSQQAQGRALIDQAEVAKLQAGKSILLIRGADPVIDDSYPIERHRRYAQIDPGHKGATHDERFDLLEWRRERRRKELEEARRVREERMRARRELRQAAREEALRRLEEQGRLDALEGAPVPEGAEEIAEQIARERERRAEGMRRRLARQIEASRRPITDAEDAAADAA